MKKILFLSYYFHPDLSAGSFRSTSLINELSSQMNLLDEDCCIDVITTKPNRYKEYVIDAEKNENFSNNISIYRKDVSKYNSSFVGQARAFFNYSRFVLTTIKSQKYVVVYATSGRLFTAFLASYVAKKVLCDNLFLDIRDIFKETITDVFEKKKILIFFLNILLPIIEKLTFNSAKAINLVSPAFYDYFLKNKLAQNSKFYFYTNGIDDIFLNTISKKTPCKLGDKVKVIYAGNIGASQCLEKTLPKAAKRLEKTHDFYIIGDGANKENLIEEIKKTGNINIFLNKPVDRNKLISLYEDSDVLFLQVDDKEAFRRVIPSKLFEYACFNKPIVSVIDGFGKEFINENIEGCYAVKPNDIDSLVKCLNSINFDFQINRSEFIKKYSRKNINQIFASSILKYIK
tara:strand:- start:233 stop:1438 length:1206 start_codon:yes stop_codon:yes gene_type:complete